MRKKPVKGSKGGVQRNVRKKVAEAAALLPAPAEAPALPAEVYNTCPKCKTRAASTDQFCRKDGTKLCLGRPCERCDSPCEESDAFCWGCGWKLGDPLPIVDTEIMPMSSSDPSNSATVSEAPTLTTADIILKLRAKMAEKGLLKETIITS
jgi:hypothetical protein